MDTRSDMLALYEHKIMPDQDFPVQLLRNHVTKKGYYFTPHWHEYIEMHYVRSGSTVIHCGQERFTPSAGELVVVNSNELHSGALESAFTDVYVLIFDYSFFAKNSLEDYVIFRHLIPRDEIIGQLFEDIFRNADFANIMKKCAEFNSLYLVFRKINRTGKSFRIP